MPDGIVQNILDAIPNKPNVVYDPFEGGNNNESMQTEWY